jgi:tetratricopeptide (TPR) repeat protein
MEEIFQFIRNGNTEAALDALESKRSTYPTHTQKAIVLLKAAWINLKNQQQMGLISTEEAERIHNRINLGTLDVGQDISSNGGGHNINLQGINADLLNEQTEKIVLQIEQATFHQVSGNQVQVGKADNVVVGSGNTITTKVNKGWGIVQYTLLILVISILGLGGWYAFQQIGNSTDNILLSLSTIQADINALAKKDSAVKNAFNDEIKEELNKGWEALQSKDLNGAIVHLSNVAEVAPAPRLLLQLGLAYREYKQEIQAEQYILKAFEADPGLKQEYIRSLRGQRINLLNITNGGSLVKASDGGMEQLLHHFNAYSGAFPCEAVFAFGDKMPATFDLFQVYVKETHGYNARHFELSVADAPTGPFKTIKSFETENAFLSGGFQDFSFPPVTARYLKMKMLDTHGQTNFGWVGDIRLMGMLTD